MTEQDDVTDENGSGCLPPIGALVWGRDDRSVTQPATEDLHDWEVQLIGRGDGWSDVITVTSYRKPRRTVELDYPDNTPSSTLVIEDVDDLCETLYLARKRTWPDAEPAPWVLREASRAQQSGYD